MRNSIIDEFVDNLRATYAKENLSQDLRDKWSDESAYDYDDYLTLSLHCVLERRIVEAFVELADQSGLTIPNNRYKKEGLTFYRPERPTIHEQVIYDLNKPIPKFQVESVIFALAQHHRLPTRMLDWTYRPLVAAFFASFTEQDLVPTPELMVVWAVKRTSLKDSNCRLVSQMRGDIGFLQAQDGVFLYDIKANYNFLDTGTWHPFDETLGLLAKNGGVWKLTLPFDQRESLLKLLGRKRVSKSFLMPSFDNVVEDIKCGRIDWINLLEG